MKHLLKLVLVTSGEKKECIRGKNGEKACLVDTNLKTYPSFSTYYSTIHVKAMNSITKISG